MKKILSLLSAFALILCLSSFSYDILTDDCWTKQYVTITNNSTCPISGTVGNYNFSLGANGSSYTYTPSGSNAKVCVTDSGCALNVDIQYTLLELCGFPPKIYSISEICSYSDGIYTSSIPTVKTCKSFSCLSPF